MNYWIFQCNPKLYDLKRRLENPVMQITWRVTRFEKEIQPGDVAFIWQAGSKSGIYAVMSVDTAPRQIIELPLEQTYYTSAGAEILSSEADRVQGEIIRRDIYIDRAELKKIPLLTELTILKSWRGTNFSVTQEQGEQLVSLIDKQIDA